MSTVTKLMPEQAKFEVMDGRTNAQTVNQTRGPKGPWVAHLRKRSKVTVEPFTEDH